MVLVRKSLPQAVPSSICSYAQTSVIEYPPQPKIAASQGGSNTTFLPEGRLAVSEQRDISDKGTLTLLPEKW